MISLLFVFSYSRYFWHTRTYFIRSF